LRVLIIHPQMAMYGGAEQVVVHLAKHLEEHGHKVAIATLSTAQHPEYDGLKVIAPPDGEQVAYRLRGGVRALTDIAKMWAKLRAIVAKQADSYDVLNPHNFPAIWAAPKGRPVVWMCNEVPDLWHSTGANGLVNKLFSAGKQADRAIVRSKCLTAVVADKRNSHIFFKRYGFAPYIVPYGIEGIFFASEQRNLPSDVFRVVCPSMVSPSKNQLGILEAVSELEFPIEVVISGYREPEHPYTQLVDEYAVRHGLNVRYVGLTSRANLRRLYASCHAAVFSGRGQGSWLGPFEQLAAGTPVVVSPRLSCSDLIAEQGIGTVTDDVAGALCSIRANYAHYQEQALKGQEFVLKELTWSRFGDRMEEVMLCAGY